MIARRVQTDAGGRSPGCWYRISVYKFPVSGHSPARTVDQWTTRDKQLAASTHASAYDPPGRPAGRYFPRILGRACRHQAAAEDPASCGQLCVYHPQGSAVLRPISADRSTGGLDAWQAATSTRRSSARAWPLTLYGQRAQPPRVLRRRSARHPSARDIRAILLGLMVCLCGLSPTPIPLPPPPESLCVLRRTHRARPAKPLLIHKLFHFTLEL